MVGTSILRLFPVDDATWGHVDKLARLVRNKAGTIQENMTQIAKDGQKLTVSMAVSPM